MGLLLVGFAFKIAIVPFHMWTPDAYEGAPAVVTGFMSTGVKVAAVVAFRARVSLGLRAVRRRLGADRCRTRRADDGAGDRGAGGAAESEADARVSSIAHGGYLLVAIVAANQVGKAAILFHLLAYSVTNLVAFGVIALLGTREREHDALPDHAGLWHTHPGLATLMTVALLALGGLPPTPGSSRSGVPAPGRA